MRPNTAVAGEEICLNSADLPTASDQVSSWCWNGLKIDSGAPPAPSPLRGTSRSLLSKTPTCLRCFFRLRYELESGREAAKIFWTTEVLREDRPREDWQLEQWGGFNPMVSHLARGLRGGGGRPPESDGAGARGGRRRVRGGGWRSGRSNATRLGRRDMQPSQGMRVR